MQGLCERGFGGREWEWEGMYLCWGYIPRIYGEVRERGLEGEEEEVREAWCMMMLRGFCWWRCYWMVGVGEGGGGGGV